MANNPIGMQKIRLILFLLKRGRSQRSIVEQAKVSRPTVRLYLSYFEATGLSYDALLKLDDQEFNKIIEAQKEKPEDIPDARRLHFLMQVEKFKNDLKRGRG